MRRVLTFILSLFLLGSSLAPCADEVEDDNIEIACEVIAVEYDHSDAGDLCSPLCVCHCCHSHLVVQQMLMNDAGALSIPLEQSAYTDPLASGFITAILQPPQI